MVKANSKNYFCPASLGIFLERVPSEQNENRLPEPREAGPIRAYPVPREVIDYSILRHEETHWLQSIGTTTGTFAQIIYDAQHNLILSLFHDGLIEKQPSIFPLSTANLMPIASAHLDAWRDLQFLYRMVFGGFRMGQEESMSRKVGLNATNALQSQMALLHTLDPTTGYFRIPQSFTGKMEWDLSNTPLIMDDESHVVLGALHLMEAGATWTEYDVLNMYAKDLLWRVTNKLGNFNVDHTRAYFSGINGIARKVMYQALETEPSQRGEVLCRILIDLALNSVLPPFVDFEYFYQNWIACLPMTRFVILSTKLRGIDLSKPFDYFDLDAYRSFAWQVYEMLEIKGSDAFPGSIADAALFLFGRYQSLSIPNDLFTLSPDKGTVYSKPFSKALFLGSRIVNCFALRKRCPELFFATGTLLASDSAQFDRYLSAIGPPLYWNEGQSVGAPSVPGEGFEQAIVHFLRTSAVMDIIRWSVSHSWTELIDRLYRRYVLSAPTPKVGLECASAAASSVFYDESMAAILKHDLTTMLNNDKSARR